jgi:flagellar biosynthesis/type III secretory pathway protein FliH
MELDPNRKETLKMFWTYSHEQGLQEGLAKGLSQGRTEGLSQGLAQGRTEGRLEGLEEGRLEGLQEGVRQHAISQLERIARHRGWTLDERTQNRIASLSTSDLDELCDAALGFTEQHQLERWLSRLVPPTH